MNIHGGKLIGSRRVRQGLPHPGFVCTALVVGAVLFAASCGRSDPLLPPTLRFGQVGELRFELLTPLGAPQGFIRQRLVWRSTGAWQLDEEVIYRGLIGSRERSRPSGDPSVFAASYASLIAQVNETPGLRLFDPRIEPIADLDCGPAGTRIRLEIEDTSRREVQVWERCASGPLTALRPDGAGPDAAAARIVQVAGAARDLTVGPDYRSPFFGTLPFGTLDQGDDSGVALDRPIFFLPLSGTGGQRIAPPSWAAFWRDHTRSSRPPPEIDWTREMVVVAAVGLRTEAGDSIRVQRILQVSDGAFVDLVQRVPGDFCSPASRSLYPYHIVVTPLTPSRVLFGTPKVERVPCGF